MNETSKSIKLPHRKALLDKYLVGVGLFLKTARFLIALFGVKCSHMLSSRFTKDKIFWAVVYSVSVYVVNHFASIQESANLTFDNKTMLRHIFHLSSVGVVRGINVSVSTKHQHAAPPLGIVRSAPRAAFIAVNSLLAGRHQSRLAARFTKFSNHATTLV